MIINKSIALFQLMMYLLEHVNHVVKINEGVIDCNNIGSLLKGSSQHQTPDAAKSVNSNSSHV